MNFLVASRVVVLLVGSILIAIPVVIAAALSRLDQKRMDARYAGIVNSEGRCVCKRDRATSRHRRNEMDQVVIDLQPDGYLVEDEHDYDDIDDNWDK